MKRVLIPVILLLVAALVTQEAAAQTRKAGVNGAAFLKIGVGARQAGLGSAVTSQTGDVTNMYWNPAGIALTDQRAQVSFTYNKWLGDLSQKAAAISYNLEDIGTIGVGFMTFGVSNIQADRDQFPTDPLLVSQQIDMGTGSTYDYTDLLFQATFARDLTDRLALGVTAKYISEKIDDQRAGAVAFDIGSIYDIGLLGWKLGARISNLGSDLKFYDFGAPIPLTFSIGTSMSPYSDDMNRLTIAVDGVKPQDGQQYYYTGAEFTFMNMISLRGGYKFNYSGTDDGGNSLRSAINTTVEGFTGGAGFAVDYQGYQMHLDYAYTQMKILSATHRITLSIGMK